MMAERKNMPSMGCQVEATSCTICGEYGQHVHKGGIAPAGYLELNGGVRFVSFGLVPAPKCESCQQPMEYLKRGTEWVCRDPICTEFNKPVVTGVGGVIK